MFLFAGNSISTLDLGQNNLVHHKANLEIAQRYISPGKHTWAILTDYNEVPQMCWFLPANQWISTDGFIHHVGLNNDSQARWTPDGIPLHVHIWTDGSCPKQQGPGGFAARIEYRASFLSISGRRTVGYTGIQIIGWHEDTTTSQYMELRAVLGGLRALQHERRAFLGVTVFLDSEWVMKCATREYNRNVYLPEWDEMDNLIAQYKVNFTKVKGHSGIFENEQVDRLAAYFRQAKANVNTVDTIQIITGHQNA